MYRLMGLALGPQLPPLDVKTVIIIYMQQAICPLNGTKHCLS